MQSLFIPPPGALQFEVMLMRRPETKCLEGRAIWVRPQTYEEKRYPTGGERFCSCEDAWVVLLESVPQPARSYVERNIIYGGLPLVCKCVGRIIE